MRAVLVLAGCLLSLPGLAAEHQVEIKAMKFNPATLEVAAGDTITFVNGDSAPHTATALDASFDTGRLDRGRSATVTVPSGEHAFRCQMHPMMKGTVSAK